jgi:hypothetical protein
MKDSAPLALATHIAGHPGPLPGRESGADDSKFALRPFFCPIESAIHPAVDAVERNCVDWLDHVRFYQDERQRARLIGTNSAEFFCRFAPGGRESTVEAAARWVYWGFAFDDARCDSGELSASPDKFMAMAGPLQRALEAPGAPVPGNDPFVSALQDIGRKFTAHATPVQVRRFADAHRAWLFGVAWQIANNALGRLPCLGEYTAMRLNCAGGPPTIAMLEIANGEEIPAAEMDSPVVRGLTEMTMLIASWDNDLHSYGKEAVEDDGGQNLVNVLKADNSWSTEQAVDQAYALRDQVMSLLLRVRERRAGRPASQALRRYLEDLGHSIRGNIDWALKVPRYNNHDGIPVQPGPDRPVVPGCTDEPSTRRTGPPPIPAIAWWWDLD